MHSYADVSHGPSYLIPFASPISRLSQDVLWSIFALNADMDSPLEYDTFQDKDFSYYTALDYVISASQVCQSWRNLLLRSPSIWGRVLRLDRLYQFRDTGRAEILKRTGDALLFMKGRAQGKHHVYSFLAELLQQNWSRLRRVDVRIGPEALYHSSLWKTFLFPAPQLVSFKVVFQGTRPRIFSSQDGFLFAGNAPSLREIGTKNMTFSIQAPWAAQLRQLQLESADFKAYETLEVIKQMPLLEYLSLSHIAGPPPVPLPAEESINIPRLTHLHLTNKLNIALPFVHAIKSSNHCTLIWASPAIDFGIPAQEAIYAIRRVLIRYSNGFFSSQSTPGALRLNLSHREFVLNVTLGTDSLIPDFAFQPSVDSAFYVKLASDFPSGTTSSFLFSLSGVDFSKITYLDFRPHHSSHLGDSQPELVTFLKSLVSVETLSVSDYGVMILGNVTPDELIFPSLHRWKLHHAMPENLVASFLANRAYIGVPISVLDLSDSSQIGDWGFLDDFDNLKVLWEKDGTENEYMCGSGGPERLNFGYQQAFNEVLQAS